MSKHFYFDGERFVNSSENPSDPNQKLQLMQGFDHYTEEEITLIARTLNDSNVVRMAKDFHSEVDFYQK